MKEMNKMEIIPIHRTDNFTQCRRSSRTRICMERNHSPKILTYHNSNYKRRKEDPQINSNTKNKLIHRGPRYIQRLRKQSKNSPVLHYWKQNHTISMLKKDGKSKLSPIRYIRVCCFSWRRAGRRFGTRNALSSGGSSGLCGSSIYLFICLNMLLYIVYI